MAAVPRRSEGSVPPRRDAARAVLDFLGLAARAGALVWGIGAVRAAAREGDVHRVILAADAAEGQRSKLLPLLEARRIPYSIVFSQVELGAATGRAPTSAVGFSNPKMAKRAGELLEASIRPEVQQGGS